mgnify:CR=1 FL=1
MSKLVNFTKLMRNKKDLLICIFFTLISQVFLTISFVKIFDYTEKTTHILNLYQKSTLFSILLYTLFFATLILIYLMVGTNLTYAQKYIIFTVFSFIEAFFLHIVLSVYSEELIKFAFYSTILIFISLFLFGLFIVYLGYDLSWLGIILFIALFVLVISSTILIVINKYTIYQKVLSIISLVIFILYIIYDTNTILLKYDNTNKYCISGALDYYLDIINIFLDILKYSSDN